VFEWVLLSVSALLLLASWGHWAAACRQAMVARAMREEADRIWEAALKTNLHASNCLRVARDHESEALRIRRRGKN
jgi:hypothetical protein